MFRSFFPSPRLFLLSALGWAAAAVLVWYAFGEALGAAVGFAAPLPDAPPTIGIAYFVTPQFLWFDLYYALVTGLFAAFWFRFSPHPWRWWSPAFSSAISSFAGAPQ